MLIARNIPFAIGTATLPHFFNDMNYLPRANSILNQENRTHITLCLSPKSTENNKLQSQFYFTE